MRRCRCSSAHSARAKVLPMRRRDAASTVESFARARLPLPSGSMGVHRWVVCVGLLVAAPAMAQPAPDSDPDTEVAGREFQRGRDLYEQGDYPGAIAAFERANDIKPRPGFDFNIGRAYDRMGQWARALDYYERYLHAIRDGEDPDTRARVETLKARLQKGAVAPSPEPVSPAAATVPVTPPAANGRGKTIAGAVVGAVGLGMLATGVAFGALAQQASDAISSADRNRQPYDSSEWQAGQRDQLLEAVFLGIGAAAVVT